MDNIDGNHWNTTQLCNGNQKLCFSFPFLGHLKEIWITLTNTFSLRHGLELRWCQTTATRKVMIQDPTFWHCYQMSSSWEIWSCFMTHQYSLTNKRLFFLMRLQLFAVFQDVSRLDTSSSSVVSNFFFFEWLYIKRGTQLKAAGTHPPEPQKNI